MTTHWNGPERTFLYNFLTWRAHTARVYTAFQRISSPARIFPLCVFLFLLCTSAAINAAIVSSFFSEIQCTLVLPWELVQWKRPASFIWNEVCRRATRFSTSHIHICATAQSAVDSEAQTMGCSLAAGSSFVSISNYAIDFDTPVVLRPKFSGCCAMFSRRGLH